MTDLFEGHKARVCGEHRTTGTRAWCFDCCQWCYPDEPCNGCELPQLRVERDRLSVLLRGMARRSVRNRRRYTAAIRAQRNWKQENLRTQMDAALAEALTDQQPEPVTNQSDRDPLHNDMADAMTSLVQAAGASATAAFTEIGRVLEPNPSDRDELVQALLTHHLDDKYERCACGNWAEGDPGVCPGWDDHIADVTFDWLIDRGYRRSVGQRQIQNATFVLETVEINDFPIPEIVKAVARAFDLEITE